MSPAREEPPVPWSTKTDNPRSTHQGLPRNIAAIDALKFSPNLQPKDYELIGTHPDSKILFLDVNILDSTGNKPYRGDVLVEGQTQSSHYINGKPLLTFTDR